jgi:DNA invertase Pin-like site-specific DNA recombinase
MDTTTAVGRAMFGNMASSCAQLERDLISERTRAAMAVLKSRGVVLGAPRRIAPSTEEKIVEYSRTMSYAAIAGRLNRERVRSPGGKPWGKSTVASVVARSRG